MHILHVYKDYAPVVGGIENLIRLLAEAQVTEGNQVTVLVTSQSRHAEQETMNGVDVLRETRLANVSSAPVSVGLGKRMRAIRPDVTHLHSPYPVGEASWLLFGRSPMVVSYQSDIVRQRILGTIWSPGLRWLLARADVVMASSPVYADTSPFLRRAADRVRIVPNGVDVSRFCNVDQTDARDTYGTGPSLAFVGRLRYYKGLHVLVDALRFVHGARMLMVGTGPEGEALRLQAETAGVNDRIVWLGDVSDDELPRVLAASDVFVLPSTARSEAYGVAMVEAMASGLPCVSTELGTGTSWVNVDGQTGLVVPPNEPRAMADAINALLDDASLRRKFGDSARQRAQGEFTDRQMVANVGAVYREAISRYRLD